MALALEITSHKQNRAKRMKIDKAFSFN